MLADKFDFLVEDERVAAGQYDLILAELQASEPQLRYLESLVDAGSPPVAVIPGPPAILSRDLTDAKLRRVQRILREARYVWAYSPELEKFCDGLIGARARSGDSVAVRSGRDAAPRRERGAAQARRAAAF